jgi:hypothetical protein
MQAKEQAPVVVAHNVGVRFILQNKTKVMKKIFFFKPFCNSFCKEILHNIM